MKDWESILAGELRRQWKRYRKALEWCQQNFSEKAVHESRVESRRLLAQLELAGSIAPVDGFKFARRTLKNHLDILDPLRDNQVKVHLLAEEARTFPEVAPLLDSLRRNERRCLRRAALQVQSVRVKRLKKIVSSIARNLAGSRDPARRLRQRKTLFRTVDRAFEKVVARRKTIDPGDVSTLHRTRVAFKNFRYMLEALKPLFREISGSRLLIMQSFQAILGELQDTDVLLARLDKFIRKNPAHAKPLAAFRHSLLQRRTTQVHSCLERVDGIFDFWPLRKRVRSRTATPRQR